jgi:hypothetical protein
MSPKSAAWSLVGVSVRLSSSVMDTSTVGGEENSFAGSGERDGEADGDDRKGFVSSASESAISITARGGDFFLRLGVDGSDGGGNEEAFAVRLDVVFAVVVVLASFFGLPRGFFAASAGTGAGTSADTKGAVDASFFGRPRGRGAVGAEVAAVVVALAAVLDVVDIDAVAP